MMATSTRRAPRPWTDSEQIKLQVMLASGVSFSESARVLGRGLSTIQRHILVSAKERQRAYSAQWAKDNRAAKRLTARAFRQRHLEQERARCREWGKANPEKVRAKRRLYCQRHPERVKAQGAKWRAENKEKTKANSRRWVERNVALKREKTRRRSALKRAQRRRALVPVLATQLEHLLSSYKGRCAYCGAQERLTIDHVLALSVGGLDEIANVVPACKSCNSKKGTSQVDLWYRSQPFYSEARWRAICRHCPGAQSSQLSIASDLGCQT